MSESQSDRVIAYIKRQREHHRRTNFRAELLALLKKHGIDVALTGLFETHHIAFRGFTRPGCNTPPFQGGYTEKICLRNGLLLVGNPSGVDWPQGSVKFPVCDFLVRHGGGRTFIGKFLRSPRVAVVMHVGSRGVSRNALVWPAEEGPRRSMGFVTGRSARARAGERREYLILGSARASLA